MKNIRIIDYLGNEFDGSWNEKFYSSKINGTKRIYIDNTEVIIKNEDVDKIGNADKANRQVIDNYFSKLNTLEREETLKFLSENLQKEYKKENDLYINIFIKNSNQYLLVEEFKKLDFENKVKSFTNMKNDYLNQKNLEATGNWHN